MWWAASRRVEVYLGSTLLGIRAPGASAAWMAVESAPAALAELRRVLQAMQTPHRKARVWLSAALARPFMIPAESGAQSDKEALAVAQASASEATGLSGDLSIWIDAWRRDRPCAAAAMPREVLEGLRSACAAANARLVSVKPWWNLALAAAARSARDRDHRLTWSLGEPDGMVQGTLTAGIPEMLEFISPISHDPGWVHSRQRAAVSSGSLTGAWHADARLAAGEDESLPIGGWKLVSDTLRSAPVSTFAVTSP